MADIIQLLPDSIANQIAAGEVIQRPASVVKELIENALDASAKEIKLIIKEAGKTLIQVLDNGKGMTATDARMSFERHATSKIREANDLFSISSMGFRGEALASIAAIAKVEMLTKPKDDELGTRIIIEGSKVKKQEPTETNVGTSFSVKNLFYNVPARRKFLKSDPVELRHITDQFNRLALANPDIFFTMYHNGNEVYHLPPGNLRQRIVGIFGKNTNDKLVPVSEDTDILKLSGYISKPEAAKKKKGDQYIFVNKRFIKSNYLNHAIRVAYDELIPKDNYAFYVIFLELSPSMIDINVHPTKTEIKFEEERLIYNFIKVSVKHALGAYTVTPTLDFGMDSNFSSRMTHDMRSDGVEREQSGDISSGPKLTQQQRDNINSWEDLYQDLQANTNQSQAITLESDLMNQGDDQPVIIASKSRKDPYQIHNTYIVNQIKSGFLLIDQQAAHERILYEGYIEQLNQHVGMTQKQLFPISVDLTPADATLLHNILHKVNAIGFEIEHFGKNSFIIHGLPVGIDNQSPEKLLETLLQQYHSNLELQLGIDRNLARSMANAACIKRGKLLQADEMHELVDQLFACTVPYKSPNGRKCFITMELDDLLKRFTT